VRALLVSRVSADLPLFKDEGSGAAFKRELVEKTGVSQDKDKAAKEISKEENDGLALDRNNPELLLIRGRRLAFEGKLDDAASEVRKAIELDKGAANYHVELAKVLMRKEGGDTQAEESLRKALSMVQDSPKLLTMLGQVQYRQKKYADAQATLEKATRDEKQRNPDARLLLGKLYRDEKKDYDRASKQIEKAAQEYFNDPTQAAGAWDELGLTLEARNKDGDKDRARASYEKSLNSDKEYAPAYCHYAKFLSRDGKEREKVRSLAQESLKQEPQGACAAEMQRLKEG
jgi:tetratricopeptide (TPR) repeat protein